MNARTTFWSALGTLTIPWLVATTTGFAQQPPTPKAPAATPRPPGPKAPAATPRPPGPKIKPACPPGAYCEPAQMVPPAELEAPPPPVEPTPPAGEPEGPRTVVIPPPPPGTDPDAPRVLVVQPDPEGGPGQVVVYEAGNHPPYVPGLYEPVRPVPPPPPEPPQKQWKRHRTWGLNMRLDGLFMPRYRSDVSGAGLVGLGLGLRYRPIPLVAVDLGADFLAGSDANGYDRQEIPFALSAIVYPNPNDLAQIYVFGGIDWAMARVFSDADEPNLARGSADEYNYFGGHIGLGVEFRVSPLVGIDIDGMALMRTRTDSDGGGSYPEFWDPDTREGSNTSTAGMMRGGVTFWW